MNLRHMAVVMTAAPLLLLSGAPSSAQPSRGIAACSPTPTGDGRSDRIATGASEHGIGQCSDFGSKATPVSGQDGPPELDNLIAPRPFAPNGTLGAQDFQPFRSSVSGP